MRVEKKTIRGGKPGDTLCLQRWDPWEWSGGILRGVDMVGQDAGYSPLFCYFCSFVFSFVLVLLRERKNRDLDE